MRAKEVRGSLKVGRNTLYDWCRQGLIPHRKVGHVILFSRRQLAEWVRNREGIK